MSLLAISINTAGVDEAGRGPLAGPVVAAAVILPDDFDIEGLDDSKKLEAATREELALRIRERAIWSISEGGLDEIEKLNIHWATMEAMRRAVEGLSTAPERILIDGNKIPRGLAAEWVVKGDGKYACIAAASILAKTHRDALMTRMAEQFPQYGFDRHFGYATPEHLRALEEHGPCAIHRMSFAPCRPDEQLAFDL